MAFSAEQFIKSFKAKDGSDDVIASPAYFEAEFIAAPKCFGNLNATLKAKMKHTLDNMKFRASAADLPSRQMVSVQRAFNGPHKLVPYSSVYASSIIEFIETPNFDIRTFFDAWQDLIEGNQRMFSTEYYENIVAPTYVVTAYTRHGKPIQKWTFYNVFPVSVNPSQLNWSTQSGMITVAVELSYYRWKFESLI